MRTPDVSRRRFLLGSAGVAALLAVPSCAYMTPKAQQAATKPVEPKIDGDLVYFNWADYVDPSVFEGFQNEYGVKVIQSNFDSMESMQAKLAAGNQYDIIFPSAQWVQKLVAANQLHTIDPSTLKNAPLIFDHYAYFADPWYDAKSGALYPVLDVQDRNRLAQRQTRRNADGRVVGSVERDVQGPYVRPRRP